MDADHQTHPQPDEQERQRALSAAIREEWRDMGPIAFASMIPVALGMTLLSPLFAGLPSWVYPIPYMLAFFGLAFWLAYRRRMESDLPFVVPRFGGFHGTHKRRLLMGGAVVATIAATFSLLLEMHAGRLLRALADGIAGWLR